MMGAPRQFLSLQGALRRRRRIGAARADAAQTDLEEPYAGPTLRRSLSTFRWTGRLTANSHRDELRKLGHSISPDGSVGFGSVMILRR